MAIEGVGPDAPTTTNEEGGSQSAIPYRCDLLPSGALLRIARVLAAGAKKHGDENWRKIPREDHLNHALMHVLSHLAGDATDDHLTHAGCRMLMAMETASHSTCGRRWPVTGSTCDKAEGHEGACSDSTHAWYDQEENGPHSARDQQCRSTVPGPDGVAARCERPIGNHQEHVAVEGGREHRWRDQDAG